MGRTPRGFSTAKKRANDAKRKEKRSAQLATAAASNASPRSHRRRRSSSAARGTVSIATRPTDGNGVADGPPVAAAAAAGRKRPYEEVVADDLMGSLLELCCGDVDRMERAVDGMINDDRFRPIMMRWMERAAKEIGSKAQDPPAAAVADHSVADVVMDDREEDGPSPRAIKRRRNLVDTATAPDLKNDAYRIEGRTAASASSLRSQAKKRMKDMFFGIGQTDEQRALSLYDFMNDKEVAGYAKAAGYFLSTDVKVAHHMIQQMKKYRERMLDNGKDSPSLGGSINTDKQGADETLLAAVANSPGRSGAKSDPSRHAVGKLLNIPKGSINRKMKRAEKKRQALKNGDGKERWSIPKKRKSYQKISNSLRKTVREWLRKHPKVVASPNKADTVLIRDPETGNVMRVAKLLRACPFRELHNDLYDDGPIGLREAWNTEVERDDPKFQLISDTMLRDIAPEELRKMNEWHKEMCQCITCATAKLMQQSLLAYRRSHLKRLEKMVAKKGREGNEEAKQHYQDRLDAYRSEVMDGEDMKYPDENVVAKALTCASVVDGIPCWKCVTRECSDCPSLTWPKEESGEYEDGGPEISYRKWETRHTCNKNGILPLGYTTCHACNDASLDDEKYEMGKVSSKKRPSRKTEPIEIFLPGEYSAAMNEYVWHKYHVLMLSNSVTGKARKAALRPGSVIGKYDYADRLKCVMNGQAQSDHFGNDIALSMEGAYIHVYSPENVQEYKTDQTTWNNAELQTEYYSHLSDDKHQNAATTYIHQSKMFKDLQERGILLTSWPKPGDTEGIYSEVQEETDGAGKQYRCGDSVHLNSMLSSEYKVAIDRATSAPTHGKGECDAKNGVDKKSVCEEMKITDVPEANEGDHVIRADAVEGDNRVSFAEEAARFLTRKHGSGGVVGGNKRKKREAAAKMKRCKYWTYKLSLIDMRWMKMNMMPLWMRLIAERGSIMWKT